MDPALSAVSAAAAQVEVRGPASAASAAATAALAQVAVRCDAVAGAAVASSTSRLRRFLSKEGAVDDDEDDDAKEDVADDDEAGSGAEDEAAAAAAAAADAKVSAPFEDTALDPKEGPLALPTSIWTDPKEGCLDASGGAAVTEAAGAVSPPKLKLAVTGAGAGSEVCFEADGAGTAPPENSTDVQVAVSLNPDTCTAAAPALSPPPSESVASPPLELEVVLCCCEIMPPATGGVDEEEGAAAASLPAITTAPTADDDGDASCISVEVVAADDEGEGSAPELLLTKLDALEEADELELDENAAKLIFGLFADVNAARAFPPENPRGAEPLEKPRGALSAFVGAAAPKPV